MTPKLSVLIPAWEQEVLVIRALDSIPRRGDVEVVVCDDGSTDRTLENLLRYQEENHSLNLRVYSNGENRGAAYTFNKLISLANGEYFHLMGNDDTVITDAYSGLIDNLYGVDVMCFDLRINTGEVFRLTEESKMYYCAQICRFIRKAFVEGIAFPEDITAVNDWYFAVDMEKRSPNTRFTGVVAYNYNFPREGSLSDLHRRGLA